MDGSARLKDVVSRLAIGVAGGGFIAMFTIGFLFGASLLAGGLILATIIHREIGRPIAARFAEIWTQMAGKSPVDARQMALFLPIALLVNALIVLGIEYYRYRAFRTESAAITNDLIDFNEERKEREPSLPPIRTQQDILKEQQAWSTFNRETDALYQKRFAARIQVACDRIRSYRTWNAGEEQSVCGDTTWGIVLYKPQAIEALSLEIDWPDWLISRTALMQFSAGLVASFMLWFIFVTLQREALRPPLPPVEATPR